MDRRGFTLVELLSVIVLIVLVMMLIVPSLVNLMNSNKRKEYQTYEDMMIEYAKIFPAYKEKSYICLNDLNMNGINNSTECNGYVTISGNILKSYLSCSKNGELLYKTEGYNLPNDC